MEYILKANPKFKDQTTLYQQNQLEGFFKSYRTIFILEREGITSLQLAKLSKQLSGFAKIFAGRNCISKKVVAKYSKQNNHILKIQPFLDQNIILIFTNSLLKVHDCVCTQLIKKMKIGSKARGDLFVKKYQTPVSHEKFSFLLSLGIDTTIRSGKRYLCQDYSLIKKDQIIESNHLALASIFKLNTFAWHIKILTIYNNGKLIKPESLRLDKNKSSELVSKCYLDILSISQNLGYPILNEMKKKLFFCLLDIMGMSKTLQCSLQGKGIISKTILNFIEFPYNIDRYYSKLMKLPEKTQPINKTVHLDDDIVVYSGPYGHDSYTSDSYEDIFSSGLFD
ncbi:60S ACIDIC ribosomal protein P0 [Anaeramoeba flamelloides]|uniref:60S ACIDIC ribosomal protein P0 n=1 Tax=Anaeramoeba flamelloides TaxID=1746091 RepID=A0AAV7ZD17_9EUKA|nr:60S ACIDIC ribosomal protein P0 [Anaeramoeba flamelloides]